MSSKCAKISVTWISGIVLIIFSFMPTFMPAINTMAQGPYLRMKTVKVLPFNNATGEAFCENGDGIISGGYSIGFSTINELFDTMLYSNHPIQKINTTGYFEGWEAGIVNKGASMATVTATTLCLNLTLTR